MSACGADPCSLLLVQLVSTCAKRWKLVTVDKDHVSIAFYLKQLLYLCHKRNCHQMSELFPVSADVSMAPKTESQSLAIIDLTRINKKKKRQTQKGAARVVENEAVASAGSSDAGAEGHKKRKPRSFCAALTGLTGVMLKQLLRNAQDTRALCGVVYDTYIVSSQWSAVISAKAQTLAYNEAVQQKGRGHGL